LPKKAIVEQIRVQGKEKREKRQVRRTESSFDNNNINAGERGDFEPLLQKKGKNRDGVPHTRGGGGGGLGGKKKPRRDYLSFMLKKEKRLFFGLEWREKGAADSASLRSNSSQWGSQRKNPSCGKKSSSAFFWLVP